MEANKSFLDYMAAFSEDNDDVLDKDLQHEKLETDDIVTLAQPYHQMNENIIRVFLGKLANNEINFQESLTYSQNKEIEEYLPDVNLDQLNVEIIECRRLMKGAKLNRIIGTIFRSIPEITDVEALLDILLKKYYPNIDVKINHLLKMINKIP